MRNIKILCFSFFIFAVFFVLSSFVNAIPDYNCPDNMRIFRISSQTNAHAEIFNGVGNYPIHICYDDYFTAFSEIPNRVCNPSNLPILNLSATTNAHVSDPGFGEGHGIGICYNKINCIFQQANIPCQTGRTEIASLSSRTNAHVGIPGRYNSSQNYKLCCRPAAICGNGICEPGENPIVCSQDCQPNMCGNNLREGSEMCDGTDLGGNTCSSLGAGTGNLQCTPQCLFDYSGCSNPPQRRIYNPVWQDALGNIIVETSVNRTVKMIVRTTGFSAGTRINFNVSEADCLLGGSPPCMLDDFIESFTAVIDSEGIAKIDDFFINDTHIARGEGILEGSQLEFYFVASVEGVTNMSDILRVNVTEGQNTPPIVNITTPVNGGIYFNGTNVTFNHNSIDPEGGPLTIRWTIIEDNFISTNNTFNYTLRTTGQKTIILRVTDNRGLWNEQQISILSVASPGMFSFINMPTHLQFIRNESLSIIFNANESYVVNSVYSPGQSCPIINCIAGVCPRATQNVPRGCNQQSINVQNTPQDFRQLLFKWRFDDGIRIEGLNNFTGLKRYAFGQEGRRLIELFLNISNDSLGIFMEQRTDRTFYLSGMHQCIDSGRTFVELNAEEREVRRFSTLSPGGNCKGPDGRVGGGDDCCPPGYQCGTNGCTPTQMTACSDYRTSNDCNNDVLNLARIDPLGRIAPECGSVVNEMIVVCACSWNVSSGLCLLNKTFHRSVVCTGSNCAPQTCTPSSCTIQSTQPGDCIGGFSVVRINSEYRAGGCPWGITSSECTSGERQVLCGAPSVRLNFFGLKQFLLSIILIGAIYFIIKRKNKK